MGTDEIRALLDLLTRLVRTQERQTEALEAIATEMLEAEDDEDEDEDEQEFD